MDVSVVENENENNITYDEKDDNKSLYYIPSFIFFLKMKLI